MFLVGLTGGIATGKSTVSRIFAHELGVPVVDADLIAKKVVEPNTKGWRRVVRVFGRSILNEDSTINRERLGSIVFDDARKRRALNQCLHGLIAWQMLAEIVRHLFAGHRYVILDVPLLFEVRRALPLLSYKLVVVCRDESEQVRRLLARQPELSERDARKRIAAQMSQSERLALADFCIDNSTPGDTASTRSQVIKINDTLKRSLNFVYVRCVVAALTLLAASALGWTLVRLIRLFTF